MAKPIKETPILKGKDAEKFIRENNAASRDCNAIEAERNRILKNYNLLKSAEAHNRHIPA